MNWTKAGLWYMSDFGYAIRQNGRKWFIYKNGTIMIYDTTGQERVCNTLSEAKQAVRKLAARDMQGGIK